MTLNKRVFFLLIVFFLHDLSFSKGLFENYYVPAKKIKSDKVYVVFGLEFDKRFDQKGRIHSDVKKYPWLYPDFSSCSIDLLKQAAKAKTLKEYKKNYHKEMKDCYLETGDGNRLRLKKNQKYYIYELPLRDRLVLKGLNFMLFAKKRDIRIKKDELKKISQNDDSSLKKDLKTLKSNLQSKRYTYISPYILEYPDKIKAGKVYYLGDFIIKLGDDAHPRLSNGKIFDAYLEYLVPSELALTRSIDTMSSWLKNTFNYDGEIEKAAPIKHKNILQSYKAREGASISVYNSYITTNSFFEMFERFEIPVLH